MTLVALLVHDRPDDLARCLDGLSRNPGAPMRVLVHLDNPDPDCVALVSGYESIRSDGVGAAEGMNRILARRHPQEDVLRLDSDTEFLEPGWLGKLLEGLKDYGAVAPVHRVFGGARYQETEVTSSGAVLLRSDVLGMLGRFRSYGLYGAEDLDWFARCKGAGFAVAYDTTVPVKTAPSNALIRKDQLEAALVAFKRREPAYLRGEELWL